MVGKESPESDIRKSICQWQKTGRINELGQGSEQFLKSLKNMIIKWCNAKHALCVLVNGDA